MAYGHVEGVSVGHPSYIGHRGAYGGVGLSWDLASVGHEVWPIGVVLDQCTQHLDDRARLGQRGRPHVDALIVERPQSRQSTRFLRRHPHLAVLLDRSYDCPDEGFQLLLSSSPAHLDDFVRKIIQRHDPGMDGVLEIVRALGDPVSPADDMALDG